MGPQDSFQMTGSVSSGVSTPLLRCEGIPKNVTPDQYNDVTILFISKEGISGANLNTKAISMIIVG